MRPQPSTRRHLGIAALALAALLSGCAEYHVDNDAGHSPNLVPPRHLVIDHFVNTDFDRRHAGEIESRLQAGLQSCGVASIVERFGPFFLSDPVRLALRATIFKADYLLGIGETETLQGAVFTEYLGANLISAPTIHGKLISYNNTEYWKAAVSVVVRPPFSNISEVVPGAVRLILQDMARNGIIGHCSQSFDLPQ